MRQFFLMMLCFCCCVLCKSGVSNTPAIKRETKNPVAKPIKDSTSKSAVREQTSLIVIISNLTAEKAPVMVTFYQKKNKFLSLTDIFKTYKFIPVGNQLTVKIDDLKYGEYAIAAFQDVNANGVIGKNLIGIPKEPYGFSNNYKPTIKAPRFSDCRFSYSRKLHTVSIVMIR